MVRLSVLQVACHLFAGHDAHLTGRASARTCNDQGIAAAPDQGPQSILERCLLANLGHKLFAGIDGRQINRVGYRVRLKVFADRDRFEDKLTVVPVLYLEVLRGSVAIQVCDEFTPVDDGFSHKVVQRLNTGDRRSLQHL